MAAMWTGPVRSTLQVSGSSSRPAICKLIFAARPFSQSTPALSNTVPPESPSYIRLSNPPQSQEIQYTRPRGHLPAPRDIFPRAESERKVQPEYIQRTAPESSKGREPSNDIQRWKTQLAESRRNNLKDGLQKLWERRSKSEAIRRRRASHRYEEHKRAAAAPEREDDRLTRATVLESIMDTKVYLDPGRFARADLSRTKLLARETAKREARRDALMELYISAADFIVDESELKAKIEQVFDENHFKASSRAVNRYGTSGNVWGMYGKPPSVTDMLEATSGASKKVVNIYESEYDRSAQRYKKIAEDLTGGKMV